MPNYKQYTRNTVDAMTDCEVRQLLSDAKQKAKRGLTGKFGQIINTLAFAIDRVAREHASASSVYVTARIKDKLWKMHRSMTPKKTPRYLEAPQSHWQDVY